MDITGFIAARHFYSGRREPITNIVLHSTQTKEVTGGAKAVARYFSTTDTPASAHVTVDPNETWQSVKFSDTAFGAKGLNANGIHIELVGFAQQSQTEWTDDYSYRTLVRAARLVKELCFLYSVPITFVDAAGLKAGAKGITTHNEVNRAFPSSGHTDPGPHFPLDWFLRQVAEGDDDLSQADVDAIKGALTAEANAVVDKVKGALTAEAEAIKAELKAYIDGHLSTSSTSGTLNVTGTLNVSDA